VNAWAGTSYCANFQLFGMASIGGTYGTCWTAKYKIGNIPDGSSNVVMLTEKIATIGGQGNLLHWPGGDWNPNEWGITFANSPWGGNWNQPPQFGAANYASLDRTRPCTPHTDSCITSMGDGTVRSVSAAMSQASWQQGFMPDDSVPLSSDWN